MTQTVKSIKTKINTVPECKIGQIPHRRIMNQTMCGVKPHSVNRED